MNVIYWLPIVIIGIFGVVFFISYMEYSISQAEIREHYINALENEVKSLRNETIKIKNRLLEEVEKTKDLKDKLVDCESRVETLNRTISVLENNEPEFIKLAKQVSKHEYDLLDYNCEDYSWDLVKLLKYYNYTARYVKGVVDCYSGYFDVESCEYYEGRHAWVVVEIPIEATTGEIIEPNVYKEVYIPK